MITDQKGKKVGTTVLNKGRWEFSPSCFSFSSDCAVQRRYSTRRSVSSRIIVPMRVPLQRGIIFRENFDSKKRSPPTLFSMFP